MGLMTAAGFLPGAGIAELPETAQSFGKAWDLFQAGDYYGAVPPAAYGLLGGIEAAGEGLLLGAAALPPLAAPGAALKVLGRAGKVSSALKRGGPLPEPQQPPLMQYPEVAPPVTKVDKGTGREYLGKAQSQEAKDVAKQITAAQRDIDAGDYEQFFDVAERADVDPSGYKLGGASTLEAASPKKEITKKKYRAMAGTPEARQRLAEAYEQGLKIEDADQWYFMRQLEDAFIEELGEEAGRQAFKQKFALPMAATTGGADPKGNLRMAMYGNYLQAHGLPYPSASHEMPYPIGGRFATGNLDMHRKMAAAGDIDPGAHPKRHNFMANFLGDKNPATIDEQVSGLFQPGLRNPPSYGPYEEVVGEVAAGYGVAPRDFQDVAWAGAKYLKDPKRYPGSKPMIQEVNEAIERTSRITGLSPKDVVVEGFIKSRIPIYGLAGAAVLAGAGSEEGLY